MIPGSPGNRAELPGSKRNAPIVLDNVGARARARARHAGGSSSG